eukprot:g37828.t1
MDNHPWEAALCSLGVSPDPGKTECLQSFQSDVDGRLYWLFAAGRVLFLLDDRLNHVRHFTRFDASLENTSSSATCILAVAVQSEGAQVQVALSLGLTIVVFSLVHPSLPFPESQSDKSEDKGKDQKGAAAKASAAVDSVLEGGQVLPVAPSSGGCLPALHPWTLTQRKAFTVKRQAKAMVWQRHSNSFSATTTCRGRWPYDLLVGGDKYLAHYVSSSTGVFSLTWIKRWRFKSRTDISRNPPPPLCVRRLRSSPEGRCIATCASIQNNVVLAYTETKVMSINDRLVPHHVREDLRHPAAVSLMEFHPQAAPECPVLLTVAADGIVRIWRPSWRVEAAPIIPTDPQKLVRKQSFSLEPTLLASPSTSQNFSQSAFDGSSSAPQTPSQASPTKKQPGAAAKPSGGATQRSRRARRRLNQSDAAYWYVACELERLEEAGTESSGPVPYRSAAWLVDGSRRRIRWDPDQDEKRSSEKEAEPAHSPDEDFEMVSESDPNAKRKAHDNPSRRANCSEAYEKEVLDPACRLLTLDASGVLSVLLLRGLLNFPRRNPTVMKLFTVALAASSWGSMACLANYRHVASTCLLWPYPSAPASFPDARMRWFSLDEQGALRRCDLTLERVVRPKTRTQEFQGTAVLVASTGGHQFETSSSSKQPMLEGPESPTGSEPLGGSPASPAGSRSLRPSRSSPDFLSALPSKSEVDWESFAKLLVDRKLSTVLRRKQGHVRGPVTCMVGDKLTSAFEKMHKHRVLSLPVLDPLQGGACVGIVDLLEMVEWMVRDVQAGPGAHASLLRKEARFKTALVRDVWMQRGFHTLPTSTCIFQALEVMVENKAKRVVLTDPNSRMTKGIITQSVLVGLLAKHVNLLSKKARQLPVRDVLKSHYIATTLETVPAVDAFHRMKRLNINGMAVVNHMGALVDVLSTGDLKAVSHVDSNFAELFTSVKEFKEKVRGNRPEVPLYVTEKDTFQTVLSLLDQNAVHRVVVVDNKMSKRPLWIISVTDILRELHTHGRSYAHARLAIEGVTADNQPAGSLMQVVSHPSLPLLATLGPKRLVLWSLPAPHPLRSALLRSAHPDYSAPGGLSFQAVLRHTPRYSCCVFLMAPPASQPGMHSVASIRQLANNIDSNASSRGKLPAGASASTDTLVTLLAGTAGQVHLYSGLADLTGDAPNWRLRARLRLPRVSSYPWGSPASSPSSGAVPSLAAPSTFPFKLEVVDVPMMEETSEERQLKRQLQREKKAVWRKKREALAAGRSPKPQPEAGLEEDEEDAAAEDDDRLIARLLVATSHAIYFCLLPSPPPLTSAALLSENKANASSAARASLVAVLTIGMPGSTAKDPAAGATAIALPSASPPLGSPGSGTGGNSRPSGSPPLGSPGSGTEGKSMFSFGNGTQYGTAFSSSVDTGSEWTAVTTCPAVRLPRTGKSSGLIVLAGDSAGFLHIFEVRAGSSLDSRRIPATQAASNNQAVNVNSPMAALHIPAPLEAVAHNIPSSVRLLLSFEAHPGRAITCVRATCLTRIATSAGDLLHLWHCLPNLHVELVPTLVKQDPPAPAPASGVPGLTSGLAVPTGAGHLGMVHSSSSVSIVSMAPLSNSNSSLNLVAMGTSATTSAGPAEQKGSEDRPAKKPRREKFRLELSMEREDAALSPLDGSAAAGLWWDILDVGDSLPRLVTLGLSLSKSQEQEDEGSEHGGKRKRGRSELGAYAKEQARMEARWKAEQIGLARATSLTLLLLRPTMQAHFLCSEHNPRGNSPSSSQAMTLSSSAMPSAHSISSASSTWDCIPLTVPACPNHFATPSLDDLRKDPEGRKRFSLQPSPSVSKVISPSGRATEPVQQEEDDEGIGADKPGSLRLVGVCALPAQAALLLILRAVPEQSNQSQGGKSARQIPPFFPLFRVVALEDLRVRTPGEAPEWLKTKNAIPERSTQGKPQGKPLPPSELPVRDPARGMRAVELLTPPVLYHPSVLRQDLMAGQIHRVRSVLAHVLVSVQRHVKLKRQIKNIVDGFMSRREKHADGYQTPEKISRKKPKPAQADFSPIRLRLDIPRLSLAYLLTKPRPPLKALDEFAALAHPAGAASVAPAPAARPGLTPQGSTTNLMKAAQVAPAKAAAPSARGVAVAAAAQVVPSKHNRVAGLTWGTSGGQVVRGEVEQEEEVVVRRRSQAAGLTWATSADLPTAGVEGEGEGQQERIARKRMRNQASRHPRCSQVVGSTWGILEVQVGEALEVAGSEGMEAGVTRPPRCTRGTPFLGGPRRGRRGGGRAGEEVEEEQEEEQAQTPSASASGSGFVQPSGDFDLGSFGSSKSSWGASSSAASQVVQPSGGFDLGNFGSSNASWGSPAPAAAAAGAKMQQPSGGFDLGHFGGSGGGGGWGGGSSGSGGWGGGGSSGQLASLQPSSSSGSSGILSSGGWGGGGSSGGWNNTSSPATASARVGKGGIDKLLEAAKISNLKGKAAALLTLLQEDAPAKTRPFDAEQAAKLSRLLLKTRLPRLDKPAQQSLRALVAAVGTLQEQSRLLDVAGSRYMAEALIFIRQLQQSLEEKSQALVVRTEQKGKDSEEDKRNQEIEWELGGGGIGSYSDYDSDELSEAEEEDLRYRKEQKALAGDEEEKKDEDEEEEVKIEIEGPTAQQTSKLAGLKSDKEAEKAGPKGENDYDPWEEDKLKACGGDASKPIGPGPQPLSSLAIAWALHSQRPTELVDLTTASESDSETELPPPPLTWSLLRALGVGYWLRDVSLLEKLALRLAKEQYLARKNPNDCALLYLATGQKSMLLGLLRTSEKHNMILKFMSMDFSEASNQQKALKNAFGCLSKRKFIAAATFFLLAGYLQDAVRVCWRQLGDFQLALLLIRLVEGLNVKNGVKSQGLSALLGVAPSTTTESGPSLSRCVAPPADSLVNRFLEQDLLPWAQNKKDAWLCHIAWWLLGRAAQSVRVLLSLQSEKRLADQYFTDSDDDQEEGETPDGDAEHSGQASGGGGGGFVPSTSSFLRMLFLTDTAAAMAVAKTPSALLKQVQRRAALAYSAQGLPLLALEEQGADVQLDMADAAGAADETASKDQPARREKREKETAVGGLGELADACLLDQNLAMLVAARCKSEERPQAELPTTVKEILQRRREAQRKKKKKKKKQKQLGSGSQAAEEDGDDSLVEESDEDAAGEESGSGSESEDWAADWGEDWEDEYSLGQENSEEEGDQDGGASDEEEGKGQGKGKSKGKGTEEEEDEVAVRRRRALQALGRLWTAPDAPSPKAAAALATALYGVEQGTGMIYRWQACCWLARDMGRLAVKFGAVDGPALLRKAKQHCQANRCWIGALELWSALPQRELQQNLTRQLRGVGTLVQNSDIYQQPPMHPSSPSFSSFSRLLQVAFREAVRWKQVLQEAMAASVGAGWVLLGPADSSQNTPIKNKRGSVVSTPTKGEGPGMALTGVGGALRSNLVPPGPGSAASPQSTPLKSAKEIARARASARRLNPNSPFTPGKQAGLRARDGLDSADRANWLPEEGVLDLILYCLKFLLLLQRKDYTKLHRALLQSDWSQTELESSHRPGAPQAIQQVANKKLFGKAGDDHVEEGMDEGVDDDLHIVTQRDFASLVEELALLGAVRELERGLGKWARFFIDRVRELPAEELGRGGNFAWPPVLRQIHGAVQTARRRLATRLLAHFRLTLLQLIEARAAYERQSLAIYGPDSADRFHVAQVLRPWRVCERRSLAPLWLHFRFDQELEPVADEVQRWCDAVPCRAPWPEAKIIEWAKKDKDPFKTLSVAGGSRYYAPLDIFKVLDTSKRDLPLALAVNPTDPRFLVVASTFGLRELDLNLTLKYRPRDEQLRLLDDEETNWRACLHRFDALEAALKRQMTAAGSGPNSGVAVSTSAGTASVASVKRNLELMEPQPLQAFVGLLRASAGPSIATEAALCQSSLHATPEYEAFTGPSLEQMLALGDKIDREQVITAISPHSTLPLYLSANTQGRVFLWHFGWPNVLAEFSLLTQEELTEPTAQSTRTIHLPHIHIPGTSRTTSTAAALESLPSAAKLATLVTSPTALVTDRGRSTSNTDVNRPPSLSLKIKRPAEESAETQGAVSSLPSPTNAPTSYIGVAPMAGGGGGGSHTHTSAAHSSSHHSLYSAASKRVTSIHFNKSGSKVAASVADGHVALWSFKYVEAAHSQAGQPTPGRTQSLAGTKRMEGKGGSRHVLPAYAHMRVMDKEAAGLTWISNSAIAVVGEAADGRNLRVVDVLVREEVERFSCHEGGALAVVHVPSNQTLVTGGLRGMLLVWDLQRMVQLAAIENTKSPSRIAHLCHDPWDGVIYSGNSDGHIQVWDAQTLEEKHEFRDVYQKTKFFNHPGAFGMWSAFGVTAIAVQGQFMFACGADGSVKLIRKRLSDQADIIP